jgi:para-aminobenzoate synthetase component 1
LGPETLSAEPLPYRRDSQTLFAPIAHRPWAMLLDSGVPVEARAGSGAEADPSGPSCGSGRFDILVAQPRQTLVTRGPLTEVRGEGVAWVSRADPFVLVRQCLGPPMDLPSDWPPGLPFPGGALGYLGYDLARRLERLPASGPDPLGLPDLAMGIYDQALVVDHDQRRTWLVGRHPGSPRARDLLRRLAEGAIPYRPRAFAVAGPLESNMDQAAYARHFARVQAWIQAGDCYQVNLARRFSVAAAGDPWSAYVRLRALSPAPFAAYLNTPAGQVLSSSPERFLRLAGRLAETRPIKGTRPRGRDRAEDQCLAAELAASAKDKAENLMIVDLLRNDLGRTCAPGSIEVPGLFEVETYPGVHHLVSTVIGRLAPGRDALDLLRGCFPGGSVTGAPKIRAMQIIDALEGEPRGVYCGSVAYLGFNGALDSNILIRTLIQARGELRFWAGGGIVADSDAEAEWQEIAVKARAMCAVVESLRGGPAGRA